MKKAGLPTTVTIPASEIIHILPRDKKARRGRPHFVLPLALGKVDLFEDVEKDEILAAIS